MIRRKVNCGICRFEQGAFRDLFGRGRGSQHLDERCENKNGREVKNSYLALGNNRCAKQRVASLHTATSGTGAENSNHAFRFPGNFCGGSSLTSATRTVLSLPSESREAMDATKEIGEVGD